MRQSFVWRAFDLGGGRIAFDLADEASGARHRLSGEVGEMERVLREMLGECVRLREERERGQPTLAAGPVSVREVQR